MNNFITEPPEFKKKVFEQTAHKMNTLASHIEKDFWVCWILELIFTQANLRDHLIFKGGTSLSKAYGIISRFSEDIDITVDRQVFGFGDELNPDSAPSNKKRKECVKQMVTACSKYIQKDFRSILETAVNEKLSFLQLGFRY